MKAAIVAVCLTVMAACADTGPRGPADPSSDATPVLSADLRAPNPQILPLAVRDLSLRVGDTYRLRVELSAPALYEERIAVGNSQPRCVRVYPAPWLTLKPGDSWGIVLIEAIWPTQGLYPARISVSANGASQRVTVEVP